MLWQDLDLEDDDISVLSLSKLNPKPAISDSHTGFMNVFVPDAKLYPPRSFLDVLSSRPKELSSKPKSGVVAQKQSTGTRSSIDKAPTSFLDVLAQPAAYNQHIKGDQDPETHLAKSYPSQWTIEETEEWVRLNGGGEAGAAVVVSYGIDGHLMVEMSETDFLRVFSAVELTARVEMRCQLEILSREGFQAS
ncbi:hypothetical protein HDU98_009033 [Podochytrium sp. JEL0797]|nr:hypothetical protein HDU98_009033 [Podochytrium sp. JEL0797]